MEAVILITLLVMCVIIVFILADNSWFKWEKTDLDEYSGDELECMCEDEDEIEDEFEELEEDDVDPLANEVLDDEENVKIDSDK